MTKEQRAAMACIISDMIKADNRLIAGVIIPTSSLELLDTGSISYIDQQKQLHHNAYAKWKTEDDEQLSIFVKEGASVQDYVDYWDRTKVLYALE